GNRFWPALHRGGFTPRQLSPFEEQELLKSGLGITNIVSRATAGADALSNDELREGGKSLLKKIRRYHPEFLAILGVGAYRQAFEDRDAKFGRQDRMIGSTRLWVLPNPSGLNAHFGLPELGRLFAELRRSIVK